MGVRMAAVGAVLAAGVVLAGCGSAAPATSGAPTVVGAGPSVAASPVCTPEAGGSATPCTEQQYAEMKRLDALYAQAEDVYRRFVAEDVKLLRSGGLAEGPVLDLIAGPMVDRYAAEKKKQHDLKITMRGDAMIAYIRRLPGRSYDGSEVALVSCLDGSGLTGLDTAGKNLGRGAVVTYNSYFKHEGSAVKLWWDESKAVASC